MNHKKLIATHRRLTLIFTGVVFVVVLALGISVLTAKYYNEQRIEKQKFSTQTTMILQSHKINGHVNGFDRLSSKNIGTTLKRIGKDESMRRFALSFFIIDANKQVIYDNMFESPENLDLRDTGEDIIYRDKGYLLRVAPLGENVFIFYTKLPYDFDGFTRDALILLCMSMLFGILFYLVGYRFVGKALKPVAQNLQDMSDFIHNAGHELKTPLAVMGGNLQVMQIEKSFDAKLLKGSLREVDRMSGLIEGLRELSEVGSLNEKTNILLTNEVSRIVTELHSFAQKSQVEISNSVTGKYIVQANQQELSVLIGNIIKNAIKYNSRPGTVKISLSKNILSISDTGKGISKEEQENIFERFFQGDSARSSEGFGIGLSLVKKIADANNWKVEVKSKEGKGSEFRIIF